MTRPIRLLAAMIFLLTLLTACAPDAAPPVASASVVDAMSAASTEGYARATAPQPFTFPADHGPHPEYATEWWYYTGNLTGADGTQYGYQLTFFRSAVSPFLEERPSDLATNQVYMAHFAITDGGAKVHRSFDRFSRGAGELAGATGDPLYEVWLEDWQATEIEPGIQQLRARTDSADGPIALDLTLTETRAPILHGDAGLSQKGPEAGNASYYYSLVGLTTTGTLTLGDRTVGRHRPQLVRPRIRHQRPLRRRRGLGLVQPATGQRRPPHVRPNPQPNRGQRHPVRGHPRRPGRHPAHLSPADFTLTPTGQWTSPRSGATYPSGWTVTFPDLAIDLTITPLIQDQEMDVAFTYWEGDGQRHWGRTMARRSLGGATWN